MKYHWELEDIPEDEGRVDYLEELKDFFLVDILYTDVFNGNMELRDVNSDQLLRLKSLVECAILQQEQKEKYGD